MKSVKRSNWIMGLCILLGVIVLSAIGWMIYSNTISSPTTTCSYSGKSYTNGQAFKSSDGCNSCTCIDGQVACTAMACTAK